MLKESDYEDFQYHNLLLEEEIDSLQRSSSEEKAKVNKPKRRKLRKRKTHKPLREKKELIGKDYDVTSK